MHESVPLYTLRLLVEANVKTVADVDDSFDSFMDHTANDIFSRVEEKENVLLQKPTWNPLLATRLRCMKIGAAARNS